jgi:hypothetical protein
MWSSLLDVPAVSLAIEVRIMDSRAEVAARLESVAVQALDSLAKDPALAVTRLVDALAGEILPWLRALHLGPEAAGAVDMEVSQVAEALTIIALRPALARGAAKDLRLVRAQIDRVRGLVAGLAAIEDLPGSSDGRRQAEDQARAELYFVAAPDRPATEAYVLRHHPRAPRVWSPGRRQIEGSGDLTHRTRREQEGRAGLTQGTSVQPDTTS